MENVFLHLVNMSITAGWIALAVMILRLFLKKAPKWITVLLWGLVGLRLILPVSIESVLSLIPSAETIPPEIVYAQEPQIHSGIEVFNSAVNPVISESLAPSGELTSINPVQVLLAIATVVWIAGVAGMLVYTLISYLRLRHKVRVSMSIEKNTYICDDINTPFILGIIKPKIYLPSNLTASEQDYVLRHEKAHIKRKDHLIKPLSFLLLSVYWFNPLLWVAYILLCRDIELACDEKVIRDMGIQDRKEYSTALLNCSIPRRMISACPLAFGEISVKQRIKTVLNYKKPAFWISIVAIILCVALSVGFLTNPVDSDKENTDSTTPTNTDSSALANFSDSFTPENLSATFTAKELIYTPSLYNYVQYPKDAPKYSLISGKRLLETKYRKITEIGVMTPIVLDEEHFDSRFLSHGPLSTITEDDKISTVPQTVSEDVRSSLDIWTEPYSLEKIKADTLCAMEVETETDFYQLLQQKNGQFLLVVGHKSDYPLTDEVDIGYSIRWIYTLTKQEHSIETLTEAITSVIPSVDFSDRVTKVAVSNQTNMLYFGNMYGNFVSEFTHLLDSIKVKQTNEVEDTKSKARLNFQIESSYARVDVVVYENDIIYIGNSYVSSNQRDSYYISEGVYKTTHQYFEKLKNETDKMYITNYENFTYTCVIKANDGTTLAETNSSRQPHIEIVDKNLLFKWEQNGTGTLTRSGRFYNLETKEISEPFVGITDYYNGVVCNSGSGEIRLQKLTEPEQVQTINTFEKPISSFIENIRDVRFTNDGKQIMVTYYSGEYQNGEEVITVTEHFDVEL